MKISRLALSFSVLTTVAQSALAQLPLQPISPVQQFGQVTEANHTKTIDSGPEAGKGKFNAWSEFGIGARSGRFTEKLLQLGVTNKYCDASLSSRTKAAVRLFGETYHYGETSLSVLGRNASVKQYADGVRVADPSKLAQVNHLVRAWTEINKVEGVTLPKPIPKYTTVKDVTQTRQTGITYSVPQLAAACTLPVFEETVYILQIPITVSVNVGSELKSKGIQASADVAQGGAVLKGTNEMSLRVKGKAGIGPKWAHAGVKGDFKIGLTKQTDDLLADGKGLKGSTSWERRAVSMDLYAYVKVNNPWPIPDLKKEKLLAADVLNVSGKSGLFRL